MQPLPVGADARRQRPILRGGALRDASAWMQAYYQTNAWSPMAVDSKAFGSKDESSVALRSGLLAHA